MNDYLNEYWEANVGFIGFQRTRNRHWCGTLVVPIRGTIMVRMPRPFTEKEARAMVDKMAMPYPRNMWASEDCPLDAVGSYRVVRSTGRKVNVSHHTSEHGVYCGLGGVGYAEVSESSVRLPETWDVVCDEYEFMYDVDDSHADRFRQHCCWRLLEQAVSFDDRVHRMRRLLCSYGEPDANSVDEGKLIEIVKRVRDWCYWKNDTLDKTIEQLERVAFESKSERVPMTSSMHKRLHW